MLLRNWDPFFFMNQACRISENTEIYSETAFFKHKPLSWRLLIWFTTMTHMHKSTLQEGPTMSHNASKDWPSKLETLQSNASIATIPGIQMESWCNSRNSTKITSVVSSKSLLRHVTTIKYKAEEIHIEEITICN